jgi:hypothetical protein
MGATSTLATIAGIKPDGAELTSRRASAARAGAAHPAPALNQPDGSVCGARVRELRRLARSTGLDEPVATLPTAVAYAAGLLGEAEPDCGVLDTTFRLPPPTTPAPAHSGTGWRPPGSRCPRYPHSSASATPAGGARGGEDGRVGRPPGMSGRSEPAMYRPARPSRRRRCQRRVRCEIRKSRVRTACQRRRSRRSVLPTWVDTRYPAWSARGCRFFCKATARASSQRCSSRSST